MYIDINCLDIVLLKLNCKLLVIMSMYFKKTVSVTGTGSRRLWYRMFARLAIVSSMID